MTEHLSRPSAPELPPDDPAWLARALRNASVHFLALALTATACFAQSKRDHVIRFVASPTHAIVPGKLLGIKAARIGPSKLLSATDRGLRISSDAGRSWDTVPVAGRNEAVLAVEIHPALPERLIVGRKDGLWISSDGGLSWDALPYPGSAPIALAFAPFQPETLYVATSQHGVHKSTDGGRQWQELNGGLPQSRAGGRVEEIRQLLVDPDDANTVLASVERLGIFRTVNGRVWDEFNDGLPFPFPRPVSPARLAQEPQAGGHRTFLAMHHPIHSHLVLTRLFVLDDNRKWRPLAANIPNNFAVKGLIVDQRRQTLQLWSDQTVLEAPLPK